MFGYIVCNKNKLNEEELIHYESVYCGLCRAIKERFGQIERFALNYDMTFLAILLNGLYEESTEKTYFTCVAHPFTKKMVFKNKYIDYAADMTILLTYYKCVDDWQDEKKIFSRLYKGVLNKDYKRIEQMYLRQVKSVKECLSKLSEIERSTSSIADEAVNLSGRMMSELFVYKEDFFSDTLRGFAYELGRFVYLMDATIDYEKDMKNNNYNPLFRMNKRPEEMKDILTSAIGNATVLFEKLPIVNDINIMRNVLYGGVWQQYATYMEEKTTDKNKNRLIMG